MAWLALSMPLFFAYSSTTFSCSGVKQTGIVLSMPNFWAGKIITLSVLERGVAFFLAPDVVSFSDVVDKDLAV